MIVDIKVKKLIIDTSAFFKQVPLWELGEEFYCVPDVIREIKDKPTRHYIVALPIQLQFRDPSPSSIKFINDFTKKTGDFAVLSLADIKILALTYELEAEAKGESSHLRSEPLIERTEQIASVKPPPCTNSVGSSHIIEGFYAPSRKVRNSSVDASQISSSSSHTSDAEEASFVLRIEHLYQVNHHLTLYPYIGGYVLTGDDFHLLEHLLSRFPLLRKLSDLAARHRIGGQWRLFLEMCQKHPLTELAGSETPYETTTEEECESLKVARMFSLEYSTQWPHLVRWFLHLLTFDEKEFEEALHCCTDIKDVSGPTSQSLEELFCRLSHRDAGGPENGNKKEYSNISDEFRKMKVDSGENEVVTGDIESSTEQTTMTCLSHPQVRTKRGEEECVSDAEGKDNEFENEDGGYEDTDGSQDDDEEDNDNMSHESESDEDECWITPSNIKSIKKHHDETPLLDKPEVACITGDYAMQNTLKHIGLHVMGVDGKIIQSLRTFILRCYACYKTTSRMEKIFCPHCGHKTLKRVSVTLNADGTQQIWISTKKPINIRGTKFSIPRPKGGKHARNPILVADQREAQQRVSKLSRMKNDPLHEDYDARSGVSPFLTRDVYSRSAQLGIRTGKKLHQGIYYWEQKNPNVPLKRGTRKKKR